MTATDELRYLLDERGVFWIDIPLVNMKRTCWKSDDEQDGYCYFEESDFGLTDLTISNPTPKQAIEATLGQGTCNLKEIDKDCDTASEYMLDREWCFDAVYRCSCGCLFGYTSHNRPHFCPNCGKHIVMEDQ